MKDATKYAFKGEKLEPKRRFACTAVKRMVKNFNFNVELVKGMVESKDSDVLVRVDKIKAGRESRYLTSPDDLIVSSDRELYAVTGEWSKDSIERLVKVLHDLKFKVVRG